MTDENLTTEPQNSNNPTELLKLMEKLNDTFTFEVDIPSLGRPLKFKQMSTGQQKKLLKTALSENKQNTEFIYALYGIMQANCVEPGFNVDKLTMLDKMFVATKLRAISVSPILKLQFDAPEDSETPDEKGEPVLINVDLDVLTEKMYEKYGTLQHPVDGVSVSVENIPYKINLKLPTIGDEIAYEKQAGAQLKAKMDKSKNEEEARTYFSEMFMYELTKYLRSIEVDLGEGPQTIEMGPLSYPQRRDFLEKLPNILTSKLTATMNEFVKEVNDLTMVKIKVGEEEKKVTVQVTTTDFFVLM